MSAKNPAEDFCRFEGNFEDRYLYLRYKDEQKCERGNRQNMIIGNKNNVSNYWNVGTTQKEKEIDEFVNNILGLIRIFKIQKNCFHFH